jgi:hypothetical protein
MNPLLQELARILDGDEKTKMIIVPREFLKELLDYLIEHEQSV